MFLAIDVGNTNIVFAVCDDRKIISTSRCITESKQDASFYHLFISKWLENEGIALQAIKNVVYASVVPMIDKVIDDLAEKHFKTKASNIKNCNFDLKIDIENPTSLGSDRIAVAVGAKNKYGNGLIIIDFGTAITFDVINEQGAFVGGVVCPGVTTSLNSLQKSAALLPKGEVNKISTRIPRNIDDALKFGSFYGYIGLVKEIVLRIKSEYNKPLRVIATGGEGCVITENVDLIDNYDPNLVIDGIIEIYLKK
ncbi:MAG: type III pantothenate kinase [Rickettsiales bacterium]